MSDSTSVQSVKPLATAATVCCLLAVTSFLSSDGVLWARLVLAAAVGLVLLIGVFAIPVPGSRFGALDGDATFRGIRNTQLLVGAAVAWASSWLMGWGVAGLIGLIAASLVAAVRWGRRESVDE